MPTDWKDWDRERWNSVLLRAIFNVSGETSTPVARINATEGFLARIAQEDPDLGQRVTESFIEVHKGTARAVRRLFDASILFGWDPRQDEPFFFSQLYLTLIVASATSETHSEGNFRKRLAILLGLDQDRDYVPSGLPTLWQALANWTFEQSRIGQPIRPLRLPDPGHETIIGFSKRLAFPMFRDEVRLARLLSDRSLSHESPIEDILHAVGSSLREFSAQFREEYLRFRRGVEGDDPGVADTPFWGAIEEVTWAPDRVQADSRRPKVRVELEIGLRDRPTFEVLVDRFECGELPDGWRIEALPVHAGDFVGFLVAAGDQSENLTSALLNMQPVMRSLMRRSHIERAVREGCLCFARGESVTWLDRSILPESGTAWLVMREDVASVARDILTKYGSGVVYWEPIPHVENWVLAGPLDCNEGFSRLSWRRPFCDLTAFKRTVARSSMYLRNSIRLSDGILFLKPMIPTVSAKGVDRVVFGVADELTAKEQEMRQSSSEANTYRFPADVARALKAPATLVLAAYRNNQVVQAKRLDIVGACSYVECRPPSDINSWLIEGDQGQLAKLTSEFESDEAVDKNPTVDRSDLPSFLMEHSGFLSKRDIRSETFAAIEWHPIDAIAPEWSDIFESLTGLFTCRSGIDFGTAIQLIKAGFDLDSDYIANLILVGLTSNHQLVRLFYRRWRGQRLFARSPTVYIDLLASTADTYIAGLVPKLVRARLINEANSMGLSVSVAVLGDWSQVGLIRIDECDIETARELARRMGFAVYETNIRAADQRLVSPVELLTQLGRRVKIDVVGRERKYWDATNSIFVDSAPNTELTMDVNILDNQQPVYVLRAAGRPIWATQSRSWASIVAIYWLCGAPLEVSARGTLSSSFPLPNSVARFSILVGEGVCGADWKTGLRGFHYPFGTLDRVYSFLQDWLPRVRHRPTTDAVARWADGIFAASESDRLAFKNRYAPKDS
jgi:hypothetical protein